MLTSALEHYRNQQRIQARGIIAARQARRRSLAQAALTVAAFQALAAREALMSVENMLDEQGIDAPSVASVAVASLAGTASDGRPLATLLDQAKTDFQFGLMVATQLKDVGRMAAGTAIVTRPAVGGYARMMNPPSCSRCAVLAGAIYKWNSGFERHPGCDCVHVPTADLDSARSGGLIASPDDYFEELPSAAELDRLYPDMTVKMRNEAGIYSQEDIFTKAGAQAIRDGANIGQIVNARRGMQVAQIGGRNALVTTEGVTRRGLAYRSLGASRESDLKLPGQRYRRSSRPRVMPETIYAHAKDREHALRLLKLNGFIL